jgi:hypothetical protein
MYALLADAAALLATIAENPMVVPNVLLSSLPSSPGAARFGRSSGRSGITPGYRQTSSRRIEIVTMGFGMA